jgi:tetratricopeptide (TPR) repeat protein
VQPLGWAGLAALAALAVHGVFDAAVYGTRMAPLLGLVAGYGWLAVRELQPAASSARLTARRALVLTVGVVALLAVTLLFRRPLLGVWYANLGAMAQTRVELQAYDPAHFDNPTLDRVRQTADLGAAERRFAQALAWDGGNLTARQRLGTIALSREQYDQGLAQLQAAWADGHRDDVTRLLLGDALVATGQVKEAAEVVHGLTWAERRLQSQAWYRYWRNEDYRRAANAWQAMTLLDPGNADAARWQAEAEARLQK